MTTNAFITVDNIDGNISDGVVLFSSILGLSSFADTNYNNIGTFMAGVDARTSVGDFPLYYRDDFMTLEDAQAAVASALSVATSMAGIEAAQVVIP